MKPDSKFAKLMVCLLAAMLAFFMTVEAAHQHPSEAPSGTHCQICSIAHVAIDTHPTVLTEYVLRTIAAVSTGEPLAGTRLVVFTAFIRPPPAAVPFVAE